MLMIRKLYQSLIRRDSGSYLIIQFVFGDVKRVLEIFIKNYSKEHLYSDMNT
ncbi:hypothetical protein BAXH7_00508 [Bacillus amyloliquefaciens XH7]|nr:hypothetical protein LL3_00500 [Bacillus amyloliquefaciens LL3]AEK87654.1 hypothetical protein BAXH7_00508 [Bacillus amyloliquefaciens XH7]